MGTNTLLTIQMITNEALMILLNNLTFTRNVSRKYDSYFGVSGAKIGQILNVRKPPRYVGRRGQGLQVEGINEQSVPVVLSTQYGCDIEVSTADMLLSIDEFSDRILKPQIATVANMIDNDGLGLYSQIPDVVGTPGTPPGASASDAAFIYMSAMVSMHNNGAPVDDMYSMYINPLMQAYAVTALKGLFQSATKIKEQYEKGTMGIAFGFDFNMDQNVWSHQIGTYAGTPQVSGGGQTGSTLITKGWTAGDTLNVGDCFTIGTGATGVFKVNPQSRQSSGELQHFVVTQPFTAVGGGALNEQVSIYPPITPAGQFQTVNQSPANSTGITIFGASGVVTPQGIGCHRDAFTFASADLPLPNGVHAAYRVADDEAGVSMRIIQAYDIQTDQMPLRVDVLGGWAVLRTELACRVAA